MGEPAIAFPAPEHFPRRERFRLEDFNEVQPGSVQWRVKGLWPSVGVCFLGGPSMTGKTFLALDMLARVCRGEAVLNRKSVRAGVVYVGAEDPGGVRLRIKGHRSAMGPLDPGRFIFIGASPNLTDPEDVQALRLVLEETAATMTAGGVRLGVACIDTMSAAIPGADENAAKDMSPVLAALQALASDLGILVLMIAHTGKDAEKGLRGWSGLLANADGLVMLEDAQGSPVRLGRVVKVKNGPCGDSFAFSLRVVELGADADGDPITTCVIEEAEAPERPRSGRKPSKAAANGEVVMRAFGRLWPDSSRSRILKTGKIVQAVEVSALRSASYALGVGPTEPDLGEDPSEAKRVRRKWQDHRKADFDRALDHLRTTDRLCTEEGWAWELKQRQGDR